MRPMTLAIATALCLWCVTAQAQTEEDCLTEAVLAESTLAKEPFEGDQLVAYSIVLRTIDGRFGSTICETVNLSYPRTTYKKVKIKVKKAIRWVRKAVVGRMYVYSYKGMKAYRNILDKSPKWLVDRARLVAQVQLAGEYEPPKEMARALYYLYPEKSNKKGKLWFACVTKPVGRAEGSVHVMHRDQTDAEMTETLEQMPECKTFITYARRANASLATRRQYATAR